MQKSLTALLLTIVVFAYHCAAQQLPTVIQPSPNAASLGKYGDIPVNYHTGVPNISIPLHEVREGSILLPISLSYHGSAIRVSETASWIGLGWALNCGGVITRSIQHVADEGPARYTPETVSNSAYWTGPNVQGNFRTGYYKDGYSFPSVSPFRPGNSWNFTSLSYTDPADATRNNMYTDAANGNLDCEPDLFFFNIGGYSGKFMFQVDKDAQGQLVRKPIFIPRADVKVEVEFGNANIPLSYGTATESRPSFISFVLTTPDGFRYTMGGASATEYSGSESYTTQSYSTSNLVQFYPSAWYVTKIEAPDGKFITLEYEPDKFSFFDLAPEKVFGGTAMQDLSHQAIMRTAISGVKLKRITSSTTEVLFEANTVREDLTQFANQTGGSEQINNVTTKRLDKIKIQPLNSNAPTKVFEFGYSYFNALDNGNFVFTIDAGSIPYFYTDKKRLRLNSVTEKSGDGLISKPPYEFSYNETPLPRRISFQQDYWGYYNGAVSNRSLIAFTAAPHNPNRKPHPDYMQAGVLSGIKYPTGGTSTFAFEPHEYQGYEQTVPQNPGTFYAASAYASTDYPADTYTPIEVIATPPAPGSPCSTTGQGCNEVKITVTISAGNGFSTTPTFDLRYSVYYNTMLAGIYKEDGTLVSGSYFSSGLLSEANSSSCPGNDWCTFSSNSNFLSITRSFIISLPPGKYRLYGHRIYDPNVVVNSQTKTALYTGSISVWLPADRDPNYVAPVTFGTYKAGGLRIAKITDSDGMSPAKIVEKKYSYLSSGILFSRPEYFFKPQWTGQEVGRYGAGKPLSQIWSASSILPMQTSQGAHMGYGKVRVEQTGNGYSEYEYDTQVRSYQVTTDPYYTSVTGGGYTANDRYVNYPPYPIPTNYERGSLRWERHYNQAGQTVATKELQYEIANTQALPGLRATKIEFVKNGNGMHYPSPTHYPTFTGISRLLKKIETSYDVQGNNPVRVVTDYAYESTKHLLLTKSTTTTSAGQIVEKMIYPPDYGTLSTTTAGIKNLQDKNLINVPIEKYTFRQGTDGSNPLVVSGVISTYKPDKLLPEEVKAVEVFSPVALSSFNHSNKTANVFSPDPRYTSRVTFHSYDAKGNIQEVSKENGVRMVYLWGYGSTLPIAEIKNSTFSEVSTVLSQNNITLSELNGGTLTDDQLRTKLNVLRQNLPRALVITFTYQPLKGITSQTSPEGITSFYEYDSLGRLLMIKDQRGDIIKSFVYHYKGQVTP